MSRFVTRQAGVAVVLGLVALVTRPGAAAVPCRPAVVLYGEAALVRSVAAELATRGISTEPQPGCDAVDATVSRASGALRVDLVKGDARTVSRDVSDAATAATVLESWARDDVSRALLEGRLPAEEHAPAGPAPVPVAATELPYSVSLVAGTARSGDGAVWLDGGLAACFVFGPACLGVLARGNFDLGETGASARLHTHRMGLDILVTGDLPVKLGTLVLRPGIGFGAGWMQSRYTGETASSSVGNVTVDAGGIRVEGRVVLSIPLFPKWWFDVGVVVDGSPLAPASSLKEEVELAGDPRWWLRGSLGLRYGAP